MKYAHSRLLLRYARATCLVVPALLMGCSQKSTFVPPDSLPPIDRERFADVSASFEGEPLAEEGHIFHTGRDGKFQLQFRMQNERDAPNSIYTGFHAKTSNNEDVLCGSGVLHGSSDASNGELLEYEGVLLVPELAGSYELRARGYFDDEDAAPVLFQSIVTVIESSDESPSNE